jgi:hypothetical protein
MRRPRKELRKRNETRWRAASSRPHPLHRRYVCINTLARECPPPSHSLCTYVCVRVKKNIIIVWAMRARLDLMGREPRGTTVEN